MVVTPRLGLVIWLLLLGGCATSRPQVPRLEPLQLTSQDAPVLDTDHFTRDRMQVSETALAEILAAPVFLEPNARIGVLPVASAYAPNEDLPVDSAPAKLAEALDASGLVDLASEVSAEWPRASGLPGLRELGARYRTEYLLLYRHRFSDASRANGFAWGFLTLIGALFLPGTTVESAGVLEATLFDVKTGTILFTVQERVQGEIQAAPPAVDHDTEALHHKLVADASQRLANQVLAQCHRLVAARPGAGRGEAALR